MKTCLYYYSFGGNSAFVADTLKNLLNVETEQLTVDNEPPKKGLGKFLQGGKSALMKEDPGLHPVRKDPADYEKIILVYPIWAGTLPPAMRSFTTRYLTSLIGKDITLIACSASGSAGKSFAQLKETFGASSVKKTLSLTSPLNKKEEAAARLEALAKELQDTP